MQINEWESSYSQALRVEEQMAKTLTPLLSDPAIPSVESVTEKLGHVGTSN
jgi:hypothetical protein